MRLSRAEAIAIIREASKQFPEGHKTLQDVTSTLCAWAVFADDALMQLQRGAAQAAEEHREILRHVENIPSSIFCPHCGQKMFIRA